MPDLWDTNPDNVVKAAGDQPARLQRPRPSQELRFKDHRGPLRSPAYILIALVIVLVAILLLIAGVMLAPR